MFALLRERPARIRVSLSLQSNFVKYLSVPRDARVTVFVRRRRPSRRASRARAHHFKSALHVELSGASSRALAPSFDISRRVAQCRPRCPEPCFAHRASRAPRRAPRARARRARTFAEPEKSSEGEYGLNPLTGEPLEAKGQLTAIVTGVVSVALALGYLALVQVMDSREMVAPPEEAFGDGSVRPADERARRGE